MNDEYILTDKELSNFIANLPNILKELEDWYLSAGNQQIPPDQRIKK